MKYVAILVLSLCSGCGTIMTGAGHSESVRFGSNRPGTKIYVDENFIGIAPVSAALTRSDDHNVRAESEGAESQVQVIRHGANLWIFGNILFGGLLGAGVDLFSGAAEGSLYPGNVQFKFTSSEPAVASLAAPSPSPVWRNAPEYDARIIREAEAMAAQRGAHIEAKGCIVRISTSTWNKMDWFERRELILKMSDYFQAKAGIRESHIRDMAGSRDIGAYVADWLRLDP